jgi:hypothetical protein
MPDFPERGDNFATVARLAPIGDCRRCGEPLASDSPLLCTAERCRQCEWCLNSDVSIRHCGDHGWLCGNCAGSLS